MDKHGYRPEPPLLAGCIGTADPGLRAQIRTIMAVPTWDQIRLANYLEAKAAKSFNRRGFGFKHRETPLSGWTCLNCPVCGSAASPDGSTVCKCDSCGHRW